MNSGITFNSIGFITQGGLVSIAVALTLGVMSILSWYLIIVKSLHAMRVKQASKLYESQFWQAASAEQGLTASGENATPLSRLAQQAIDAAEHHNRHANKELADMCNQDEFIARSMRRAISEEQANLEAGLTVLASVGSVSPFIGLFGTVWGIYHALVSIGASGQATLDKVAGPVGEALIMTALGLAVAIPAVLAYNALVRSNRMLMAQLETFAHDLHTLLVTGSALNVASVNKSAKPKTQVPNLKEVTA